MLNTLKFQRNPAIAKAPEVAFRGQFLELMGGVEPPTFSLRMRCSAIKLHQQVRIALCKYNRARLIIQSVFIPCPRASVLPLKLSERVSSPGEQR